MVFNSLDFLIFFPVVTLIYLIIPKKLKTVWLLISSYFFYMSWNATYAILIFVSTLVTYLSGVLMERTDKKKLIVALSFIINLGILFVFKYLDFAISNLNTLLYSLSLKPLSGSLKLLLPVGISFYTFQALGYTIDVYRGRIEPEKNFLRYALFVSFFPQLVAGPIERSGNLLSQIQKVGKEKMVSYDKIVSGFSMMCYGMFIKMVIADRISIFVDYVWNNFQIIGTVEGILSAVAFSIQIYCDFAGYSLIAIGAARVMGFELMENFNTPYLAVSISDFWRRWHISLSTWFRDYLYIPLGGSRCSKIKKYRNIMITFLVSGLWHGANWTYVIWGGLHGLYQIIGDLLMTPRKAIRKFLKVNEEAESFKLGQILFTFIPVTFAWIFFRADSLKQAITFIKHMLTKPNPWVLFDGSLFLLGLNRSECNILFFALLVMVIVDLIRYFKGKDFGAYMLNQNLWFRILVLTILILACLVYGEYGIHFDTAQFIYFQF